MTQSFRTARWGGSRRNAASAASQAFHRFVLEATSMAASPSVKVLSKMSGVVATVSSMDSWLRVEGSSTVVSGSVDSNSSIEALF